MFCHFWQVTDLEALAMPYPRYQAFLRYRTRYLKELEKASRR